MMSVGKALLANRRVRGALCAWQLGCGGTAITLDYDRLMNPRLVPVCEVHRGRKGERRVAGDC